MIFDKHNNFSEDQAITVTANSTNVVDLGPAKMGEGEPIEVLVQVTTAFAGGTSIAFTLETDDNEAISSATDIQDVAAVATAGLTQGTQITFSALPRACERYLRLAYTVVGTMSAGKIFAGLNLDRNTWEAKADGL